MPANHIRPTATSPERGTTTHRCLALLKAAKNLDLMQETNQSSKLCRDGADCRGHVLARDALISEVSYVGVVPQRSSRRCCDVDMFLISPPSPCRLPPQPAHNQGLCLLHKSLTAPTNKPRWAPNAGRWAASSFHITKHQRLMSAVNRLLASLLAASFFCTSTTSSASWTRPKQNDSSFET